MAATAPAQRTVTYSADGLSQLAAEDLREGLLRHELWLTFAIFDIRQRFKRSMLGPLWLTISMGVMVAALALVFGTLFGQDIGRFVPHIATGLITWGLITAVVIDGGQAFIAAEGYIRSVPMPLSVHIYRVFARNIIIWVFNMAIYLVVWVIYLRTLTPEYLLFIPGFALLCINLLWMNIAIAVVSTRFRDIPQVIASGIQVIFFVTPIFWSVEDMPQRPAFVILNPFYHLIEIVRAPLLGTAPHLASWLVSIGIAVVGSFVAWYLYRRAYPRIAYWI